MTKAKIIELLQSGNFTIVYNDNGAASLYKGYQTNLEKLPRPVSEFNEFWGEGYAPDVVQALVMALGGMLDSF